MYGRDPIKRAEHLAAKDKLYPPQSPSPNPAKSQGLQVHCDSCGEILTDFGALLFSPPVARDVKKYHICVRCFDSKFKPQIKP